MEYSGHVRGNLMALALALGDGVISFGGMFDYNFSFRPFSLSCGVCTLQQLLSLLLHRAG